MTDMSQLERATLHEAITMYQNQLAERSDPGAWMNEPGYLKMYLERAEQMAICSQLQQRLMY